MGKTFVNILLDESGSMESVRDQVIGGFNEYINGLISSEAKRIRVSLTKFDTTGFNPDYVGAKLKNVPKLTRKNYKPNAMTPLYDAVGRMVRSLEQQVAQNSIKQGDKVLVVIQTDGHENASKEWTKKAIKKLLKEKQKNGWTFVFLGADQNAWDGAESMGVTKWNTFAYASNDTMKVWSDQLVTSTVAYTCGIGDAGNFFSKSSAGDSLDSSGTTSTPINSTSDVIYRTIVGDVVNDNSTSAPDFDDNSTSNAGSSLTDRTIITTTDGKDLEI